MHPHVETIFTAPEGSASTVEREDVEVVAGGIVGDRYRERTGENSPYPVHEVTLIDAADIDRIREEHGIDLSDGRHRRNVVTRGVDLDSLLGATFRVGDAVLAGDQRRPPCSHVENLAGEAGVEDALAGRGGIGADVVIPGEIAAGDRIEIVAAGSEIER